MPVIFNRLPAIASAAAGKVDVALAKTAADTETLAKTMAPVDTGNLRGSIMSDKVREFTWRVTANAEYALYVEMGAYNVRAKKPMAAQPYLDPALRQTWPSLLVALGTLV